MLPTNSVSTLAALDLEYPGLKKTDGRKQRILDQYGLDPVKVVVKPKERGVIAAAKRAFEHLESYYHEHVPLCIRERVTWIKDLANKGCKLIGQTVKVVLPIIETVRNTAEAAVLHMPKFMKALRKLKVLSILGAGGILYSLAMNVKGFAKSVFKNNISRGVDRGLMIIENVGDIAGLAETVLGGLKEAGMVAATESFKFACSALLGVSAVLSAASIILNAKHWYESARFRMRMNQKFGGTTGKEENFKNVVNLFDEQKNSRLRRLFGVKDGGELKVRLHSILRMDEDKKTPQTKEKINEAMKALKKRLIAKDICHGLKILAGVISIIGCAVLLFGGPAAPAGFAFLVLATAISIAVLVTDHVMTMQLEKTMNRLIPDDLEMPSKPEMPVLKGKDPADKARYAAELEKYEKEMESYSVKKQKYLDEIEYVKPIRAYKWEASGKNAFRKKVNRIIYWNPKKRKKTNNNAIEMETIHRINSENIQHYFNNRTDKIDSEKLQAIEKRLGGMTFNQIKNWIPPEKKALKSIATEIA